MIKYINRNASKKISKYFTAFPAIALLGPRQCGKSTLANKMISENNNWIYLDLEKASDMRKLNDPELYFSSIGDKSVCLDEIQLRPKLFPELRSIIDIRKRNGQLLILGSASPAIIRQSSESLAGRIGFIELTPFTMSELYNEDDYSINNHWFKGGFPRSWLLNNELSNEWRDNFIKTYLERDIPSLGFNITSSQVHRLLKMIAHSQGQVFNASKLSESLGINRNSLKKWVDILSQTYMVRILLSYEGNLKKRLIKSPKVYIRDSGILHTLLEIDNFETLIGHPSFGSSWESMAIENIIAEYSKYTPSFYRSTNGAEIDLVLSKGTKKIAFEFKASTSPTVSKGFYYAIKDLEADQAFLVIPKGESYPIKKGITVISLEELLRANDSIKSGMQT
jgi:predicted AAA+ superfamily ATPase